MEVAVSSTSSFGLVLSETAQPSLGIPRIGPTPTPNVGYMPADMSCTLHKQDSRPLIICRNSFAVHDAIDIAALSQSAEPYQQ